MATEKTSPEDVIRNVFAQRECLLMILSDAGPSRHNEKVPAKITVRPVEIQRREMWQLTLHWPQSVTHENHDTVTAVTNVLEALSQTYRQATLFTASHDYHLRRRGQGGWTITSGPPSKKPAAKVATHNRSKDYILPEGVPNPFLCEIGVMTPEGHVRAAMQHKFRQINRFLEFVQDVVPHLPGDKTLQVVDFGCGKSYLTFALHHLLTAVHGREVHIAGLDRKREVIEDCRRIAGRLHCRGLEFQVGELKDLEPSEQIDLAVALHACDTATDDALAHAVKWGSQVILAVPCCQHELAPQLDAAVLRPMLKQGIVRERLASLVTDALRAQLLELCGYATQIVEFIDLEHTAKNLLLRSVRRTTTDPSQPAKWAEYQAYRQFWHLECPYLERRLRELGCWSGLDEA